MYDISRMVMYVCRTDCIFSPDEQMIVTGVSVKKDPGTEVRSLWCVVGVANQMGGRGSSLVHSEQGEADVLQQGVDQSA